MKEAIRQLFISLGVDICGFAAIDKFSDAPEGFSPKDIYPHCNSVIVIAKALPKSMSQINPRLIYHHFNELTFHQIDDIELQGALQLEQNYHCHAIPVPCDTPYEYWSDEERTGRGLMLMKHAAMSAGLGTIGKSTLLLNDDYGTFLNIGAVLTDLKLPSDNPSPGQCIPGCTLCIDSCPAKAINESRVSQSLCRSVIESQTAKGYEALNCNGCRTICPKNK